VGRPALWPSIFVFLFLVACGVILLLVSESLRVGVPKRLTEELGIVLISVFGVSLIYEHVIAETHFQKLYGHLEGLIGGAQNNAARCASLGIDEIHETRSSYEATHSFKIFIETCGSGGTMRIVGRSLIYSMQAWEEYLRVFVQNGGTLELCFYAPDIQNSPLEELSGYDLRETEMALDIFERTARPWLESEKPPGKVEIRFHRVHLLDSFCEFISPNQHLIVWDLNFGRGTSHRRIFVLKGGSQMGKNLSEGRYSSIWNSAEPFYLYSPNASDTGMRVRTTGSSA
jgi:hypothetical protein